MAELINNRKSVFSSENATVECQGEVNKAAKTNENSTPLVLNNTEENTRTTNFTNADHISLISKSTIKSFSRLLPRNVVGTIGRKTSLLTRRTLRSGRGSLKSLNQGWDTVSQFSSLEDESVSDNSHSQEGVNQKQKQQLHLHKNYTLRLRKIKEKFKTKRHSKRDRFGTLQIASPNRFRKDLNQSKIESNNKQEKLLEKLLQKHNKHLESL